MDSATSALDNPALRVPYDILVEIFHAATDLYMYEVGQGPLFGIIGVCTGWRNAALECPSLWSTFWVDMYVDLVQTYLQRSRSCLLRIHLIANIRLRPSRSDSRQYNLDTVQRMFRILADHSDRFWTLGFSGVDWPQLLPSFSGFRGRLSSLEMLDLDNEALFETGEFQIAPELHTLTTLGPCLAGTTNLPHAQIRSLRISWTRDSWGLRNDCIRQLESFPNLSSLTLEFKAGSEPSSVIYIIESMFDVHSAGITLPFLSYWKIQVPFKVPPLGWMLDHFKTPALETLDIAYFTQPSNLCDLFRRSQCSLKRLALRRCTIRGGDLLNILELTPSLDSLVIENGSVPTMVTNRFFDSLTFTAGRHPIVPVLRELEITGQYCFSGPKVLEMVDSRVGRGLSVVEMVFFREALIMKEADVVRLDRAFKGLRGHGHGHGGQSLPARPRTTSVFLGLRNGEGGLTSWTCVASRYANTWCIRDIQHDCGTDRPAPVYYGSYRGYSSRDCTTHLITVV
ncbi:hypothetical protein FB45DRAFT_874868 [Roridomyces roridus]|uniref:F-box domain-containing protein n=1 Tax=Roridomyces roridus TaxID=1738132 RepID=A0AAD7FCW3_9AGAR|nr:hypothetical protein FB45DRAFT_874868 [Roridomyces roridus]